MRATFLKDWRRQRETDVRLERDRSVFGGLPLKERLARLRRRAILTLRERGFRSWAVWRPPHWLHFRNTIYDLSHAALTLGASRRERGRLILVIVHALHSSTKTELDRLAGLTSGEVFANEVEESDTPPKRGAIHSFVLSLQPVAASRLDAALPSYFPGQPTGHYSRRDFVRLGADTIPFIATLDCISDIKSEREFRSSFEDRVSHIGEA